MEEITICTKMSSNLFLYNRKKGKNGKEKKTILLLLLLLSLNIFTSQSTQRVGDKQILSKDLNIGL
jgi:hypothetical protein